MHVVETPAYGSPSILSFRDAPRPSVGPDEVLIAVEHTLVTAGDRRLRSADFPGVSAVLGRLMMGVTGPRQPVQGTNFAGRVVETGSAVTRFAIGDSVFGSCDYGANAEFLAVSEQSPIAHVPAGVLPEHAVAAPYGAGTALHFLRDLAAVKPGEHVLVLGGTGGVGRYAIQLAKHLGAEVTAVCGADGELALELGADQVIDYRSEDFTRSETRYDVIFDVADATTFSRCKGALTEGGRYLTLFISMQALGWVAWTSLVGGRRAHFDVAMGSRESVDELAGLLAEGVIWPVIAARFPLAQLSLAHALGEGGAHGEVLVDVAPAPRLLASA